MASSPGGASDHKVGVAVSASSLGYGLDAALRVAPKANLRVGGHFFNFTHDFDDEDQGITYKGKLTMRSMHAYIDWFPFGGGFHVSPGMILNNGNKASLTASLLPGQSVEINNTEYYSTAVDPIRAAVGVTVKSTRPAILIGWGNIVGQKRKFSVPFELGVIFQGVPTGTMSFTGTACAFNGLNCRNMSTDATIQNNIKADEADLNNDLRKIRFYPVLSLGVAIRF
jgi:hypothetical protein